MSVPVINSPCAWSVRDLPAPSRWQLELTPSDIDELDAALEFAIRRAARWDRLTREDFPLPRLARRLRDLGRELEEGCGMTRLRGLPCERYGDQHLRLLWMGICRHLGEPVFQNAHGQRLREIKDEGPDVGHRYGQLRTRSGNGVFLSSRARVASCAALRFHTDRADVVGLLCVRQAQRGGISKIASSVAVHNRMRGHFPELHALLCRDYHRSRLGEEAGGEQRAYALPVFGSRDRKFTSHYSRTYIEAAQQLPGVPKLSDAQWRALDVLAAVAEENCIEMTLASGDMQFLNNHVIYHARTAFEDDPRAAHSRLLYRIWLSVPDSRALPEGYEVLWRNIEAGALRGGISQAPRARSPGTAPG